MGVAIFIVPEREPDGVDTFVDGKAMARVSDQGWDEVCAQAGVPTLFVLQDLTDCERIFERLQAQGIRRHFQVDC